MSCYTDALKRVVVIFVLNTLVAVTLWGLGLHRGLGGIWVASQCIGFACVAVSALLGRVWSRGRRGVRMWVAVVLGVPLGTLLAFLLGVPLEGETLVSALQAIWRYILLSALISMGFHLYYANRARQHELEEARSSAALREAAMQKTALNAQLRALQAQIEPHFLFNTLANLHSLIGRDDLTARAMLERLNDYLRATLAHSRAQTATLGDELKMLEAFLAIQAQRMGGRLIWQVDVADTLRGLPLPPMLLQPLVENAITHGIEPKLGPGQVLIRAQVQDGQLLVSVHDDGCGFGDTGGAGIGLANVRERLAALYGSQARLDIRNNTPTGVVAEIWIALDALAP